MQVGYKWLSELVDFGWDAVELCDRLTMAGVACEVAGPVFDKFSGVVVGKVKTVKPHPSSDKLKICEVDSGIKTVITVCMWRAQCQGGYEIRLCRHRRNPARRPGDYSGR